MIASMHNLDHRLSELRPSEHDQQVARWLRDAASSPRAIVRTLGTAAGQWLILARVGGQSSRLSAG
jgi:hypothetical protein